jgi:hypothetical protein
MEAPTPTISAKKQWYLNHKNDANIVQCMRDARKKYYYANRDKEKARSLARYYALKGLTPPIVVPTVEPPPPQPE